MSLRTARKWDSRYRFGGGAALVDKRPSRALSRQTDGKTCKGTAPCKRPTEEHVAADAPPFVPFRVSGCRHKKSALRTFHSAPCILAERKGLEPSASGVTGRRYNRLNYRSSWWAVQDLNLWPPPCKGGAQPTELTAPGNNALLPDTRGVVKRRSVGDRFPFSFFAGWLGHSRRPAGETKPVLCRFAA